MSNESSQQRLNYYLSTEARKGLNIWLGISFSLTTVVILVWFVFNYSHNEKAISKVISAVLENRSNTFSEMFIQRDLEQFLSLKNQGSLIPLSVRVFRGSHLIAEGGRVGNIAFMKRWSVPTISGPEPYEVELRTALWPYLLIYFSCLFVLMISYRWLLGSIMKNFDRSFDEVSFAFSHVIDDLKAEDFEHEKRQPFFEFSELQFISRRWKAELHRYRDEIAKLSYAEVEGRIARQVAHDIRSPLSVLKIVSESKKPMTQETSKILRSACERIESISNSLNEIARKAALSKIKFVNQNFINRIWDNLIKEKSIEYSDYNITFLKESEWNEYDVVKIRDIVRLERTFSNLINNSILASQKKPMKISLVLRKKDGEIGFEIKDDGPGIPEFLLSKFGFEPVSYYGTGIGISSAFSWAKDENGLISIQSNSDSGTTIRIMWKCV